MGAADDAGIEDVRGRLTPKPACADELAVDAGIGTGFETEREGGPEVLAPVGNAISGGLSEFDDAPRRGAMVVGHKKERRSKRR